MNIAVVSPYDMQTDPLKINCEVCITINLRCMGTECILKQVQNKAHQKAVASDVRHFFRTDGDIEFHTDNYGHPLAIAELDDCIEALEHDVVAMDNYRRVEWALAMLKSVRDGRGAYEFKVLFWGT